MKEVQPKKSKKRLVKLPPQESANDTSNWENRNISAVSINKVTGNRIVREVEFIEPKQTKVMALNQIQRSKKQKRKK